MKLPASRETTGRPHWHRRAGRPGIFSLLALCMPLAWLEAVRLIGGAPPSWEGFGVRVVAVAGMLLVALAMGMTCARLGRWAAVGGAVSVGAGAAYALTGATAAGWAVLVAGYAFFLIVDDMLAAGRPLPWRYVVHGLIATLAGTVPVAVAQLESRFSEEEFFAALQTVALSAFWLLLLLTWRVTSSRVFLPRPKPSRGRRPWGELSLVLGAIFGATGVVGAYQQSFYPAQAPRYPGISIAAPFICGAVPPDGQVVDGEQLFQRILARVEANPQKGAPELGMLALSTGEQRRADEFRERLLEEATEGLFTGPAHSVKSVQLYAATRAYYYPRVAAAFPDLFTADDQQVIGGWFEAINRRALTVEWVDWMYALALGQWPEGPYENQETGAGLLSMLETGGLSPPELSASNRDYLERNRRAWSARFRNTDDAVIYQPEWIQNAYFQSLYTGEAPDENLRRSFEWLLLQALPDGVRLRYNHPFASPMVNVGYLGATLTHDPRYLWLAARALDQIEAEGRYLPAQPGVERPVRLTGRSPVEGSCLIYGDSGLPTQAGPLAPDKIVFREGWAEDDTYMLLNLRFTGWHRYKATNSLTLFYSGEPLIAEELTGRPYSWLPTGRSFFRDKRIPRENLNGLVVERSGMSKVLYQMTGSGGPWAQDPPFYAHVEQFQTGDELDISTTVLEGWHGWRHSRTVYFMRHGPTVIVDNVSGPPGARAALVWHALGDGPVEDGRLRLGAEGNAEMIVLPTGPGRPDAVVGPREGSEPNVEVSYEVAGSAGAGLVTVLLTDEWLGAETRITEEADGPVLHILRDDAEMALPLSGHDVTP